MATGGTLTNFDLIEDALRKIGVVGLGAVATAEEVETARRGLDRMLKAWQNRDLALWTTASLSVPLTTAASYALAARALDVQSVRLRRGTWDRPLRRLARDEWDRLPNKALAGQPSSWHYDRQREAGTLWLWPGLANPQGETLEVTYTREIEDVALAEPADVPGEWHDAVVYGLAARLVDDFMVAAPNVIARAEDELDRALAFDREGSVYFVDPDADWRW